jgi:hypothetical protein
MEYGVFDGEIEYSIDHPPNDVAHRTERKLTDSPKI